MNADDAVRVLRAAMRGDRVLFNAFELLLAERDKLFTNGIEALAQVTKLQEEARTRAGAPALPRNSTHPSGDQVTPLDRLEAAHVRAGLQVYGGKHALAAYDALVMQAEALARLQAWSAATSPKCNTRSVMFVGPTFSLVWEDADGEGCHREAPSLEAAAGFVELGAVPK